MREMTNSILNMLNLRCCIIQENRDVQPFPAYVGRNAREDKPMGRGASLINMHLKQFGLGHRKLGLLILGFWNYKVR